MEKPKVLRVILHPGEIRSRYDGDIHYISFGQLAQLYNVLRTDIVVRWNYETRFEFPIERQQREGWLNLYPQYRHEDYYDIHANDQFDVVRPEAVFDFFKKPRKKPRKKKKVI